MVIFLQGCNFKCSYCHNPETLNLCSNCGQCLTVCPVEALHKVEGKVLWKEKLCINCDECIKICKNLSSPKTKDFTIETLVEQIKKVEPFIEGITVSGGECTLNPLFLEKLFQEIKKQTKLTCFIDTNGSTDIVNYETLLNLTDGFMLDVKAVNLEEHKTLTGMDNRIVLKNLELFLTHKKLYEVRTVIAPGLDNEATVKWVASKIQDRCVYKLLTYRRFGVRSDGLLIHGMENTSEKYMKELLEIAKNCGANQAILV